MKVTTHPVEDYSLIIIFISLIFSLLSYVLGLILTFGFHTFVAFIYLILIFFNLLLSLKLRCSYCYYYDRWCYTGFGKLSAIFFKRGPSSEFKNPRNIYPIAFLSSLLLIFPLIIGILELILTFNLYIILLLSIYLLITFTPNFVIKRKTCEKCKQRSFYCPIDTKRSKDIPLPIH